jgi:hypothetical protein
VTDWSDEETDNPLYADDRNYQAPAHRRQFAKLAGPAAQPLKVLGRSSATQREKPMTNRRRSIGLIASHASSSTESLRKADTAEPIERSSVRVSS